MKQFTAVTLMLALLSGSAFAAMATGEQLTAAVSGNTIQGNMDATGAYAEFYAADGTVFGKDYKAKWSIEGDTMCWIYEGQPKDCFGVDLEGDQVKWLKDGKPLGSGMLVKGNPNNFQ